MATGPAVPAPGPSPSVDPDPAGARTDRARLTDVARAAGVSIASASRSLNDRRGVASETRARVLRAAAALGYQRTADGAALAAPRPRPSPVTMLQVATAAGVSVATVSRVVNHQPGVSARTRARVEDVIVTMNYRVCEAAANLARHRSARP